LISINTAAFRLFDGVSTSSSPSQAYDAFSELNLSKGDVVNGQVLKNFASGDILLLIHGKQIKAQTRIPLPTGMHVSLKLSSAKGLPTLKLIQAQETHLQGRKINLPTIQGAIENNVWGLLYDALDDEMLSQDHSDIKSLIEKISQLVFTHPGGEGLKALIDASGLTWENKLADVLTKSALTSDLMEVLNSGDLKGLISKVVMNTKGSDTVLQALLSALDNIQLLNIHGNNQARLLFLPLPLQFIHGTIGLAQVLVQFPQEGTSKERGKKEDSQYKIVMFIELSSLGPIRTEIVLTGIKIQGRFLVQQKNALECIDAHIPSFMDTLNERGFSIDYMGCQQVKSDIVKQSLVNEIFPREGSSICVVA